MILIFSNATHANPFEDSAHKKLYASLSSSLEKVPLREANVELPEIFSGSSEQFLSYVEKFSVNRKDYLLRTYQRSKKYFPKAIAILKKHQIPAEFAVLLALESGFNGNAVSNAGAVGYWQIMDEVAKEYGLRIAPKEDQALTLSKKKLAATIKSRKKLDVDERKNFLKSTVAAARYLRDRHRNLNGDWLLITASYNCGVGNVWDAMQRCGKAHPTFWDIKNYLPAETRAYVMNFITLNVIFKNYKKFAANDLCFRDIVARREPLED
jgi:membrane-bound lytic murein transglycosylase D